MQMLSGKNGYHFSSYNAVCVLDKALNGEWR
jgi:hypothetical protein